MFRLKPWKHEFNENEVVWGGWAKMALPISGCRVVQVKKPLVGEVPNYSYKIKYYNNLFNNYQQAPSDVQADIQISLPARFDLRDEWQSIRKCDVLFMVKVKPIHSVGHKFDVRSPFKSQFDITYVRGCEVMGIIGPDGNVLDEMGKRPMEIGTKITL
jgi:intron-binding protein aquarius